MSKSLADQLLSAGLTDKKKAKQVEKDKKKQKKQQFKSREKVVDEAKLAAQQLMEEKKEKSRALNRQRESEQQSKAIAAQIKQLINKNRVEGEGDIGFNFVDQGKVKKLYVNPKIQSDLEKGRLAIVTSEGSYAMVPAIIAEKIEQREPSSVLLSGKTTEELDEDDPYAEFKIPDDLMW